ncbi:MAG: PQQ-binding-like beta-propeller repeat protein [Sinobacteraceae bacterium]|nr:PQQ-binding-like beta-propeller repeat protein [Nevskiaceae bacterium]
MKMVEACPPKYWLCFVCFAFLVLSLPAVAGDWPMFGQNISNTSSTHESRISRENVASLKPRWIATLGGGVSARAAVVDGVAYVPDWGGNISAIDMRTGQTRWTHPLTYYGLAAGTFARTSPAVAHGLVYIGTQYNIGINFNPSAPPIATGWMLALNARTGEKVWMVQPDASGALPVITASPTVFWNMLFVGMTSNEESAAIVNSYPCCSGRGSVVALDAFTGKKIWQTYTVPKGYSGANVWGSSPIVDPSRLTVYVTTGNNYSVPTDPAYTSCIAAGGTELSCLSPDNHVDSILALNLLTGAIRWATQVTDWNQAGVTPGSDINNGGCDFGGTNCPTGQVGPDWDFASGPNEITYRGKHGLTTIIGAGQKSGLYTAVDPDTGAIVWQTQVGPGSIMGGMEWGSASDGTRIYVAIGNPFGIPYAAGNAGSWAALDPATGKILWQVPDPNGSNVLGVDMGPVTVANGVLYAPSMSPVPTAPTMFALDASTGATLWSYAAGSSVLAGATVAEGTVLWGSGYSRGGTPFTDNNKLFSFEVQP